MSSGPEAGRGQHKPHAAKRKARGAGRWARPGVPRCAAVWACP